MSAQPRRVTDRLATYRLDLSCECHPHYRIAPPSIGDIIMCMKHGAATVMGKERVNQSGNFQHEVSMGQANVKRAD